MVRVLNPLDLRTAILTGTSGGITGGDIIPDGMIGVVRHIVYSEMSATGQNVRVRTMPSGIDLDVRNLSARENWPGGGWNMPPDGMIGYIGQSNVLQVVTSQANVMVRVQYTIQDGRASG